MELLRVRHQGGSCLLVMNVAYPALLNSKFFNFLRKIKKNLLNFQMRVSKNNIFNVGPIDLIVTRLLIGNQVEANI